MYAWLLFFRGPPKNGGFPLASLQTPQQTDALKTEGTPIVHLMSQSKCSEIPEQKDDKDQSDQSFALVSPPEIGGLKTRKNWANVMSPGVPAMAGNKVFLCTPRVNAQKAKKSGVSLFHGPSCSLHAPLAFKFGPECCGMKLSLVVLMAYSLQDVRLADWPQ